MQDVHPIGGISGAVVGSGRVFGDRRLRPHTHHLNQQALKCPRCDSLNTKFCYYNNYNLSQPRHFCKNCRRYWTKGGVLRNVPVGGGCRKSKRSKPKQPSSATAVRKLPNSLSSSDSSATNATTTTTSSAGLFQISESESFGINVGRLEPLMESGHNNHNLQIEDQAMLFSSLEMGGFVNDVLMNNSGDPLGLVGGAAELFGQFDSQWDDEKVHGVRVLDPTVRMDDLLGHRGSNSGLVALDCQAGSESGTSGLFDLLPNSFEVDDRRYWSQTTSSNSHLDHPQWSDHPNSHLPLSSSLPFF